MSVAMGDGNSGGTIAVGDGNGSGGEDGVTNDDVGDNGDGVTNDDDDDDCDGTMDDDVDGSELPIIKTVSVIRKSPKYLAELLMDSSRLKLYNKMSLGRTDVRVFQSGIDTVGGPFGDGESKVVRNLSRPPLVSGIIEFVTCMHGRRLRPEDDGVLGGDDGDDSGDGYIVVSRAVLGGGGGGGSGGSRRRQTSIISTARSWFVTRSSWG